MTLLASLPGLLWASMASSRLLVRPSWRKKTRCPTPQSGAVRNSSGPAPPCVMTSARPLPMWWTRRSEKKTCLDHFVETYIDRFNADMEEIATAQPSFVSASLLKWMRNETDRLRATADSVSAFHNRAGDPVHGDLNE